MSALKEIHKPNALCAFCRELFGPDQKQFSHKGGENHDGFHLECLSDLREIIRSHPGLRLSESAYPCPVDKIPIDLKCVDRDHALMRALDPLVDQKQLKIERKIEWIKGRIPEALTTAAATGGGFGSIVFGLGGFVTGKISALVGASLVGAPIIAAWITAALATDGELEGRVMRGAQKIARMVSFDNVLTGTIMGALAANGIIWALQLPNPAYAEGGEALTAATAALVGGVVAGVRSFL